MMSSFSRSAAVLMAIVLALATAPLTGCGTDNTGGDGANTCPKGQLFSPASGKCVDDPGADGGNIGSSGGTSSGGTSGGSSSGGSDTTEKELPWALDDSGGLAKDTSAPFDAWWECPPEKKNPGGKLHGQKCEKDSDCLYGRCFIGGPLAAYDNSIKFCTKNNGCGSGNLTSCTVDNTGSDFFYSAFEKSKSGGNTKRDPKKDVHKMCAKGCKGDSDCAKWNPALPHCLKTSNKFISFGTNPICGVDPDK